MPGQIQLPAIPVPISFPLGIDCIDLDVLDPGGPSNHIINAGASFNVSAEFLLGGVVSTFFGPGGTGAATPFTVTYYYEGMGGAPDGVLGNASGTTGAGVLLVSPGAPVFKYTGAVTTLAAPVTLPTPGVYKLSAVVTIAGLGYTAFVDGPMIRQL